MNTVNKRLQKYFEDAREAQGPTLVEIEEVVDAALPTAKPKHDRRETWFGNRGRIALVGAAVGCLAVVSVSVVSQLGGPGLDGVVVDRAAAASLPGKSIIHIRASIEYLTDGKREPFHPGIPEQVETWQVSDGRSHIVSWDGHGDLLEMSQTTEKGISVYDPNVRDKVVFNPQPLYPASAKDGNITSQDPAAMYQAQIQEKKSLKLDGETVVDGVPVYELTKLYGTVCSPDGFCEVKDRSNKSVKMKIFIDKKTYRPVKIDLSFVVEPGQGFNDKKAIASYVVHFEKFDKLPLNHKNERLLKANFPKGK